MSPGKNLFTKFAYLARDLVFKETFRTILTHCRGKVLDVGGWDFYARIKDKGIQFDHWTNLEHNKDHVFFGQDPKYTYIVGDGQQMPFADGQFDTVLNIQVIEHVFEPIKMFNEIVRVLKPNGYAVFLVPQTGVIHQLPHHYQNFTPFWFKEAARRSQVEIVELKLLGGVFATMASHMVYLYPQIFRVEGYTTPEYRRNILFYVLMPLMILYTLINIPVCLLLSMGDIKENANNFLVVIKKHG